jgi:hypothetical protein
MRKITLLLTSIGLIFFAACGKDGGIGINNNSYMAGLIEESELSEHWSGNWKSLNGSGSGSISLDLTLKGTSDNGSASMSGFPCMTDGDISGSFSGRNITFDIVSVSGADSINFNGISSGILMKGNYAVIHWACSLDHGTFTAKKQ